MEEIMQFVMTHGYGVIVFWVLLDQIGFPIPAIPVLIVAGALTGTDAFHLPGVLAASTLGCLPSDLLWFEAGRRRGGGGRFARQSFARWPTRADPGSDGDRRR